MKSFKEYLLEMSYTQSNVQRIKTTDLGTVYTWLAFGNAARRGLDDREKKAKDVIGSELGQRARKGEDSAKMFLNNRMGQNVDKYGKPKEFKKAPPKSLLKKILSRFKKQNRGYIKPSMDNLPIDLTGPSSGIY